MDCDLTYEILKHQVIFWKVALLFLLELYGIISMAYIGNVVTYTDYNLTSNILIRSHNNKIIFIIWVFSFYQCWLVLGFGQ